MEQLATFIAANQGTFILACVLVLGAPPSVLLTRFLLYVTSHTSDIGKPAAAAFEHYVKNPAVDHKVGELCLYAEQKMAALDDGGFQRYDFVFKQVAKEFPFLSNAAIDHKIEAYIPVLNGIIHATGEDLLNVAAEQTNAMHDLSNNQALANSINLRAISAAEAAATQTAPAAVPDQQVVPASTDRLTPLIPIQTGNAFVPSTTGAITASVPVTSGLSTDANAPSPAAPAV